MFKLKQEIIDTGKIVYENGLVDSHSGNISIRNENSIFVTGTGTKLGYLKLNDIIDFFINSKIPPLASSETVIHKSIYLNTNFKAIIHTHSFFSVLLSFFYDSIVPEDSEGLFFNPSVPVLDCGNITIGSHCVNVNIYNLFEKSKCVIVKGHGVFTVGENLDTALKHTTALENSCKLIYYKSTFERKIQ